MCAYNVYKQLEDYKVALSEHERLLYAQDTTIRFAMRQSLIEVQRDYYHSLAENHALKLKNNRILYVSGSIIGLLAVFLIMVYYNYQLVRKQRKLDDYIGLQQELEEKVSNMGNEIDSVNVRLRELFSHQYELLNQLCKIYYENPGTNKEKAIYSKVKNEIDSFKNNTDFFDELEVIVNECHNNVMLKLRSGMPNLRPVEYRLFCFYCAGFSPKAISLFTDDICSNVYVKKKRLKDKIMNAKPQDWQEIIRFIES